MTTIIYKDGVLTADRRVMVTVGDSHNFVTDSPKLFISADRRMAYAYTGGIPRAAYRLECEQMYARAIDAFGNNRAPQAFPKNCDWRGVTAVMTKDAFFEITVSDGRPTLHIVEDIPYWAAGSGGKLALISMEFVDTRKEIYDAVSRSDDLTGTSFDTVTQKDLIAWDADLTKVKASKSRKSRTTQTAKGVTE